MRYLIHKNSSIEIPGRCSYLYDIFNMYFFPKDTEGDFIALVPIGTEDFDIMFITGHINQVEDYLKSNIQTIPEKAIVVNTCYSKQLKKYMDKKDIFIPKHEANLCCIRDGKQYGFDFNPTNAELDLYNASGSIYKKIQAAYRRL